VGGAWNYQGDWADHPRNLHNREKANFDSCLDLFERLSAR